MNKRQFTDNLQRFYRTHLKALDICNALGLVIEAKGFEEFFITFDISDGVLLVDRDSNQWQLSTDVINLIYSCTSQEELERELYKIKMGL